MELNDIEEVPGTELALQDRAAVALNSTKTEADLRAMATKFTHITAIVDKAGREQAHGAAMELKRARTTIEKVAKDAREDATKFAKAVIAEAARLTCITEPEETRLLGLRDAWDAKAEAERQAKAAAERARVLTITRAIADITGYQVMAAGCRTSSQVQELAQKLEASQEGIDPAAFYQEFSEEAKEALQIARTTLKDAYNDRASQEQAQAEREAAAAAERKRIEEARALLAKEQEAARIESERREAEARAEADKARAELEAERAAIQAEREAMRREQEALRATLAPEPVVFPIEEVKVEGIRLISNPEPIQAPDPVAIPTEPTAKEYAAGLIDDCVTVITAMYGLTRAEALQTLRCAANELIKE